MNITPQTTSIPAPQFKPQKSETITSFCDFLEGKGYPQWPHEMFLEVSNVCDLRCAMCAAFSGLNPNRFLKIKTLERGLLEIADFSNLDSLLQHAILVHCFGYGEATIHPRFKEILDYVLNYEVLVHFTTNGMHLTEELCQLVVDRKVFKITISFSGTNKPDYENVYLGGNFETVLAGISRLNHEKQRQGSKFPLIEINSLGFQHQVDSIIEFIDLMSTVGVNAILLSPLLNYLDNSQLHAHVAVINSETERQLEKAKQYAATRGIWFDYLQFIEEYVNPVRDKSNSLPIREIKAIAKNIVPIHPPKGGQEVFSTEHALEQKEDSIGEFLGIQTISTPLDIPCFEPFYNFYLRVSGQVIPCCFSANYPTPSLGDAGKHSAEKIWRGLGFQVIREGILAEQYPVKICKECIKLKHYPKHHAMHHKVNAYADWFRQVFGQEFDLHLQNRTIRLGNLSNRDVIEKWKLLNSSIQMGTAENPFAVSGRIFTLPKTVKPPYSWIEHIPFAFFLISTLKPKILVELGVYIGNSYNAFCQAVSLLKTGTQCYGIDTWQGDEHASFYDESVYDELFAYQQREYQNFSSLLRMTFDEAQSHFADSTIDLFHIDGFHTYEAVKHDFDNWLPKMSDQGVVIFHDTEVRETDFGVWQFWEELAQTYPSFNFKHGYGLGIIAVGSKAPQEFLNFLQTANQEPFYQGLFASLGHHITVLEQNKILEKSVRSQHLFAQLLIDTGEGFEERNSIIKMVTGKETQLEFDLSAYSGIQQLRFDPLDDLTAVEIQHIAVLLEDGELRPITDYQTNALCQLEENCFIFDHPDSQITIPWHVESRPQQLIISLKYVSFGKDIYRLLWEQEQLTVAQQTQQLQQLRHELEPLLHPPYVAQLFIDTGLGFSESQSILHPVTGEETELEFDLSAYPKIRQLRFDPLNDLTILEMQQFVIQDDQGMWHPLVNFQTNLTYAKDNYLVFGTNDPQILIDVQPIQRPLKVIFQFKYVTLGEKTYRPLWEMEHEQTQQLAGRVRQLEQLFQPQGRR